MTTYYHIVEPDLAAAFAFLGELYETTTEIGWVNLFHIDKKSGQRATAWAPLWGNGGLAQLGKPLLELAPRGDMWFGVAPRREQLSEGRRGGVADCVSIPALWLDIDVANDVHKLPGLPQSYEEARRLALSFPLSPSMVVWSGYGLQVWWRLTESLSAPEALALLPRWQVTWERLADKAGLHVDNVSNIDRVMRLPGTFNFKSGQPVKVTYKGKPRAYEHADIEACLDALPVKESAPRLSTGHLAGSRFNEIVTCQEVLRTFGLVLVRRDNNGDEHWHYSGAANETSCTVYGEDGHCAIWSETMASTYGMELRRPYDSFGLWTWLKHGGDFALAHAELVRNGITDLGFGSSMQQMLAPPTRHEAPSAVRVVTADQAEPERVKWIWPQWLPAAKLVMLDGDPDAGKSTMTLDLAARISTGALMPDGVPGIGPAGVVLLSAEDDLNDTIVWRLKAAGADLSRIHHVQAAIDGTEEMPITIPRDLRLLESVINDTHSALVIVDVLNEYLAENVDGYKDQSVRRTLYMVRGVAKRTGAAFLMLRHLRKEGSLKAIYRGGGSIGIVGAARAGWAVGIHPEDESVRVLATIKMNLAPRPPALAFKLMPHDSMPCAYVDWRGVIDINANQLLDPIQLKEQEEANENKSKLQQCREAIETLLPVGIANAMLSNELRASVLKAVKCSERTYNAAHKEVEFGQGWRVPLKDGTMGMMVWRPDWERPENNERQ